MKKRAAGFTLIELLVVVAIIGLLISILLPSLRSAKEQAHTVKCIANLKQVGNAMLMYFGDHNNWFPSEKRNWPEAAPGKMGGFVVSAFHYGGHPGRPGANGEGSATFEHPRLRDTFRGRPFNPYLYDNLYDQLETMADVGTAEFEERRKSLTLFECPSDTGGYYNNNTNTLTDEYTPIHWRHGSSYDINYHFIWRWAALRAPTEHRLRYLERSNRFLQKQREQNVSRFVVLVEDPFDSAGWNNVPKMGWHGKWNKHSFLFLDGHSANVYADASTGLGNYGPNWKTAGRGLRPDGSPIQWFNNPDDPDYQYRDLGP